jgi:outer membrane protein assembly factor BamB
MLRLRLGQRWRREAGAPPLDALGLEVDGVDLLAGASEEPLAEVVPALLEAVHALACLGRQLAQLSLPEAHLEVLLARRGDEVELKVASLGRPARLVRPGVRVDGEALVRAVVRELGREGQLEALASRAAPGEGEARWRGAAAQLAALSRGGFPHREGPPREAFRDALPAPRPLGFSATLEDADDLLRAAGTDRAAALASLLCGGEVALEAEGRRLWGARGAPFLVALELSRQGQDVLRARESGQGRLVLRLAGQPQEVLLEGLGAAPGGGQARLGGAVLPGGPEALAAALFELGLALSLHVTRRHAPQGLNPYLTELTERCTRGLAVLRPTRPAPEAAPAAGTRAPGEAGAAATRRRRSGAEAALAGPGALRRLHFAPLWERVEATDDPRARLLLLPEGPVVVGRDAARAFAGATGAPRWERAGARGAAVTEDGHAVLVAEAGRVLLYAPGAASARWLRSHEGLLPGPQLLAAGGALLAVSGERTLVALEAATGRERWRATPAHTPRLLPAVLGGRVLLATDAGALLGLSPADGRARFQLRGDWPCVAPPLGWGRRALVLRAAPASETAELWAGSPATGETAWRRGLALARPAPPLASGARLYVLGSRGERAVLVALDARGRVRWERALPLGAGPLSLALHGTAVLAASADGTAVRVSAEGKLEWRLGTAGEGLAAAVPPQVRRGVAFVPGPLVRAVDPAGGRLLAEVEAEAPVRALAVDARLTLFLLDEEGTLSAHRLVSHLGVAGGP